MESDEKYVIGKFDYDKMEDLEKDIKTPFEQIMEYLTEEHENLTENDPKRKSDFDIVAEMFLKKLQTLSKSIRTHELNMEQIEEYKGAIEDLIKSEPEIIPEKCESEDEFTIYKEKDKHRVRKFTNPVKDQEEFKIPIPRKRTEEKIEIIEDDYTLADLIPIKGETNKSKKPKANKKYKTMQVTTKAWPTMEDASHKLSLDEIIKQEEEKKELDIILKQIEDQENLEKAIELSKQEFELSKTKQEKSNKYYNKNNYDQYNYEDHSGYYQYNRGYPRGKRRGCRRGGAIYRRKDYY